MTLVSVIEWSLRWYGLAALLLVWAALGAWTLIHTALPNKEARKEKEYKTRRIVVKAVTMLLLVTVALIPPLVFPQYELIKTTGEHKVATVLYTYTDKNRVETYTNTGEKRKLNVEFWYPKDYDKAALHTYPLVIFSPGGFGVRSSNESLFNELASHGYVVGSIDHTYQSLYTTDVYGNTILSPFLTRVFNGQSSATDTVYGLKTINKVALDFFDSYLKGRGPFTSAGTY